MVPTLRAERQSARAAARTNDPWTTALRLLTGRDFSRAGLRRRLLDKGFDPEPVEEVLRRCGEAGYLDDARYALNRVTTLLARGRAVGPLILADLRRQGVSEEVACVAMDKVRATCDEAALLESLLERRFPNFSYDAAPVRERRRVVNFLQRRGFALGRIMDQLTRKGCATYDEDRE